MAREKATIDVVRMNWALKRGWQWLVQTHIMYKRQLELYRKRNIPLTTKQQQLLDGDNLEDLEKLGHPKHEPKGYFAITELSAIAEQQGDVSV